METAISNPCSMTLNAGLVFIAHDIICRGVYSRTKESTHRIQGDISFPNAGTGGAQFVIQIKPGTRSGNEISDTALGDSYTNLK